MTRTHHSLLTTHLRAATFLILLLGCGQPQPKPLTGKLSVLVRSADRTLEPVLVESAGAVPVQSGGAMFLDVHLDEPGFIYLVWIDSEARVLPLYPWNNDRLEVTDINQPPPIRRASKLVFSPIIGGSWTFNNHPGAETVLLLARRTPLPQETQIGPLLNASPPPSSSERPEEVITVRLTGRGTPPSTSATADNPANNAALAAFLKPLTDHFDLIHAIQFTHAAEDRESGRVGEGETK